MITYQLNHTLGLLETAWNCSHGSLKMMMIFERCARSDRELLRLMILIVLRLLLLLLFIIDEIILFHFFCIPNYDARA